MISLRECLFAVLRIKLLDSFQPPVLLKYGWLAKEYKHFKLLSNKYYEKTMLILAFVLFTIILKIIFFRG
jgi:hypothetical protein